MSGTSSNDTIYVSYSSSTSQVVILVSGGMSYRANFATANLAHIVLYGAAELEVGHVAEFSAVPPAPTIREAVRRARHRLPR